MAVAGLVASREAYVTKTQQRKIWGIVAAICFSAIIASMFIPFSDGKSTGQGGLTHGNGSPVINQSGAWNTLITQQGTGNTANVYMTDTNALAAVMEKTLKGYFAKNENGLSNKFDLGYAIFGITESKEVVPFKDALKREIVVDWQNKNYFVVMDRENISLHLPDMYLEPAIRIHGQVAALPRKVGARSGIYRDDMMGIDVEIAESSTDGVVMVLGIKRLRIPPRR